MCARTYSYVHSITVQLQDTTHFYSVQINIFDIKTPLRLIHSLITVREVDQVWMWVPIQIHCEVYAVDFSSLNMQLLRHPRNVFE